MGASDGKAEFQVRGGADVDMQLGRDLRGHAFGYDAGGVIAGREEFEREAAFGIAGRGVTHASRSVHHGDRSLRDAAAGGVEHSAADRSGGVLGGEGCGDQDREEYQDRNNVRCGHKVASEYGMRLGGQPDAR